MRASTVLLIILFSTVSFAGSIETVIAPPAEMPQAGQSTVFDVYFHNSEDKSLQVDVPDSTMCRLSAGDKTVEVKAYAIRATSEKTMTICPGGFGKIQYSLDLPSIIEGAVTMKIPDFKEDPYYVCGPKQRRFEKIDKRKNRISGIRDPWIHCMNCTSRTSKISRHMIPCIFSWEPILKKANFKSA